MSFAREAARVGLCTAGPCPRFPLAHSLPPTLASHLLSLSLSPLSPSKIPFPLSSTTSSLLGPFFDLSLAPNTPVPAAEIPPRFPPVRVISSNLTFFLCACSSVRASIREIPARQQVPPPPLSGLRFDRILPNIFLTLSPSQLSSEVGSIADRPEKVVDAAVVVAASSHISFQWVWVWVWVACVVYLRGALCVQSQCSTPRFFASHQCLPWSPPSSSPASSSCPSHAPVT